MFEIIINLLMENKYLMFFSQPPPIYTFYTERERTNQDGGYDCLDNYLAPLSSEISLMVCYMNDSVNPSRREETGVTVINIPVNLLPS